MPEVDGRYGNHKKKGENQMKKVLFPILALVLALGLALPGAMPVAAHMEGCPFTTDLLAGQTEDVGDVSVWNDGTNLYVQYVLDDPWVMTGSHLYVGKSDPTAIEMWSTPGQLPYSPGMEKSPSEGASYNSATMTYTIPLGEIYAYEFESKGKKGKGKGLIALDDPPPGVEPCDDVYIAAHADVVRPIEDCWEEVWQIGYVETDPLDSPTLSDEFGGKNTDGTLYALSDPLDYNIPLNNFTRDYDFDTDAFPHAFAPDGWTAGDFDGFVSTVNINYTEDMPFGGNLTWRWTAGNSGFETYDVSHDGSLLQTYVDPGSRPEAFWQHSLNIPAASGDQVITFYHYANDDPVGENPDGGDGGRWDWIRLEKPCEQEETAWGDGTRFGTNWAMYFKYHVQFLTELEDEVGTTAEWSTTEYKSPPCSIHLDTGTAATGSEARIVITLPSGTTLGQIQSISWWTKLVSGYVPHVDISLDTDAVPDGARDAILVAEGAYQNGDLTTGWPSGWFQTFAGVTAAYPSWAGLSGTPNLTQVDGTTAVWLSPSTPTPDQLSIAKLSDYQSVSGLYGVSGSTPVLFLEIEVDNWVAQSEAYVDDIVIILVP